MRKNSQFLQTLAISRFVAALVVVVSHYMQFGLIPRNDLFLSKFHGGGIAVTYFFVLSGFILAHNYSGDLEDFDYRKYFIKRFSRIFPMLIFSGAICGLIIVIIRGNITLSQKAFMPQSFSEGIIAGMSQMAGISAWLPFSAVQGVLNAPSWSVGCEIFFYICFPFLMKLIYGSFSFRVYLAFIFLNLFLILIMFELTWDNFSNRAGLLLDRFPLFHLFEFILGIVTCMFTEKYQKIYGIRWKLASILALLIITIFVIDTRYSFLVLSPVYSLLIWVLSGTFMNSFNGRIWRLFILLGNASYSLYLLHWGIGIILITYIDYPLARIFCIPLSVILSVASFKLIENPAKSRMIRGLTKRFSR